MHLNRFITALALGFMISCSSFAGESVLKIMSFNLRYASDRKPNSWPERRPVMKECIQKANPDIFGTQEGLYHQLKDIEHDIKDYRWIAGSR